MNIYFNEHFTNKQYILDLLKLNEVSFNIMDDLDSFNTKEDVCLLVGDSCGADHRCALGLIFVDSFSVQPLSDYPLGYIIVKKDIKDDDLIDQFRRIESLSTKFENIFHLLSKDVHDLLGALSHVSGYAQILTLEDNLTEDAVDNIKIIKESSDEVVKEIHSFRSNILNYFLGVKLS